MRPMMTCLGTVNLSLALLFTAACSSTPEKPESADPRLKPLTFVDDGKDGTNRDKKIQRLVLNLGQAQSGYANLMADLPRAESKRKLDSVNTYLTNTVSRHLQDLLQVLAVGTDIQRATVAWSVGFSKDVEAIQPLINALRDQSPGVVKHACLGLWTLGLPQIPTRPLIDLVRHHKDRGCRSNAVMALAALARYKKGDKAFKAFLMECLKMGDSPKVRLHALTGLRHLATADDLPLLAPLKHDPTPMVRWALTSVLWSTGSPKAIPHLIDLVSSREPNANVRIYAQKYLINMAGGTNAGKDEREWRKVFAKELEETGGTAR